MALCLADTLLETGRVDQADLMGRFVRWWRTGEISSTGTFFESWANRSAAAVQTMTRWKFRLRVTLWGQGDSTSLLPVERVRYGPYKPGNACNGTRLTSPTRHQNTSVTERYGRYPVVKCGSTSRRRS